MEGDDDRIRSIGQENVAFVDSANGVVKQLDFDFVVIELGQFDFDRFQRSTDVRLEDELEILYFASRLLAEELVERDVLADSLAFDTFSRSAFLGDFSGAGEIVDDEKSLAGAWDFIKPVQQDGGSRGRPR